MIKIELPSIRAQQRAIFEESTKEAIKQLKENLKAPELPPQTEVDEGQFDNRHLLTEQEGWKAPDQEIVRAYFNHLQQHFPAYNTDKKLAELLGLSSDRRIREIKEGSRKAPYGVWRKLLILTGRAPQEIIPVLAFMG